MPIFVGLNQTEEVKKIKTFSFSMAFDWLIYWEMGMESVADNVTAAFNYDIYQHQSLYVADEYRKCFFEKILKAEIVATFG